eukprot:TRINITY_DN3513_c0_g1_i1.p1 TRINITY_DN3513_c0_g1~~TRINITY_DN3513_c0_g1_i1.p1  ORF type:complete len:442 (+),score=73.25 TRINITY_DN3513_c0_g1_i1:156-1481(+)
MAVLTRVLTANNELDTAWVLQNAFNIFYMQAGFACLEAGFVRSKNTKQIILKNFIDCSIGVIAFYCIGYGIGFGPSEWSGGVLGGDFYFLIGQPDLADFLFQLVFAATAATIVSGALAERTQVFSYMIYTSLVSGIIYPVIAQWMWNEDGWMVTLGENGVLDFAGGGVVHLLSGCIALTGAYLVGPRAGRFRGDGKVGDFPMHNFPLAALGVLILWYTWHSFNAGSTGGLSQGRDEVAAKVAVVTSLGAATSMLVVLLCRYILTRKYDISQSMNGVLAGLVSITAPCGYVEPWAGVVIGGVGGLLYVGTSWLVMRVKIDDPLEVVAVHGSTGLWGMISVGLLGTKSNIEDATLRTTSEWGLFYGGGVEQLGLQVLGIVIILAWGLSTGFVLFFTLKYFRILRVGAETELAGMDITKHGGDAYPEFERRNPEENLLNSIGDD